MRTHFPNEPAGLRAKAEFFQRLARATRYIPIREELEKLSVRSMEEAAALERKLAIPGAPVEIGPRDSSRQHPKIRSLGQNRGVVK